MAISRFTVHHNEVIDPGSVCTNPTITPTNFQGFAQPCDDGDSIDIQINSDSTGPYCIDFVVDCSASCSSCGSFVVTKCFCVNVDDCGNCSNCVDHVCVSRCADGQVCDGDTCSECNGENPCPSNQQCVQGKCKCEGGLKKRADGKCVECFDTDELGNCLACDDGVIVAVDCPNGHCNPNTGDCQGCLNNSHCGTNECCDNQGGCSCCAGYVLNVDGDCVPVDPCTNAQFCIDHYGPCYTCTADGCVPKSCPNGWVCDPLSGDCVPPCGNCPVGSGCINGACVPCNTLNCGGAGLQCQFADGCQCVGTTCEYVNCNIDNVELDWETTPDIPGQPVSGTGLPALTATTSITPTGMVYLDPPTGSGYQNHSFSLAITNGPTGAWTLYHTPTSTISLGSGTSITFDLAGTGHNLVGFIVKFVGTDGRTAEWAFQRALVPLDAAGPPSVWSYEYRSNGIPPQTNGGSPGTISLCANNSNFILTGVTNVVTTGSLVVTFYPNGTNCMGVSTSGCGIWNGDVLAKCGGETVTIHAPELFKNPANCCEPTDPNCGGWGTGDPCTGVSIQNIDLVAFPTFGQNGSGDGEFLVVADTASAGLSFFDLFYLNPAAGCWSTANNPEAASNDIQIVTSPAQSPFGPSASGLAVTVTLGDGGCIRLGYDCDLIIPGCKKLQGELCMTECDVFAVNIVDLGSNQFKAVPSLNDEAVTFVWVYNNVQIGTSQTVTVTPVAGSTTLIVTARYGTPTKCTATDSLNINTTIAGCTNPTACNYSSGANVDDGSCVIVGVPTYACFGGFNFGSGITGSTTFKIGSTLISAGDLYAPGDYTVDVYVAGILKCSRAVHIPTCYTCSGDDCVHVDGYNAGEYTDDNTCQGKCGCNIQISQLTHSGCSSGVANLYVNATGRSGNYRVTINSLSRPGFVLVSGATFNSASGYNVINVCPGLYTVTVSDFDDATCSDTASINFTCPCVEGSVTLTSVSHNCDTNSLAFTIGGGTCSQTYTVELLDDDGVSLVPPVVNPVPYNAAGAKTLNTGTLTAGNYILRLADNNNCSTTAPVVVCASDLEPCSIVSLLVGAPTSDGSTITISGVLNVDDATGIYSLRLYNIAPGVCGTWDGFTGDVQGGPIIITTPNVYPVGNSFSFEGISLPTETTCFGVRVTRTNGDDEDCTDLTETTQFIFPTGPTPTCSGAIPSAVYLPETEEIAVTYGFLNSSGSLTAEIYVDSGACDSIGALTITQTGLGASGTGITFGPIPQILGVNQCIYIKIFDEADSTCYAEEYIQVIGCECAVEILSVEPDPIEEEIVLTYRTKCTSGQVDFEVTGPDIADILYSDNATSTDGEWLEAFTVLSVPDYPSSASTVDATGTDNSDGGCTHSLLNTALSGNCEACSQVASLFDDDAVVTSIRDEDANLIVTGAYDLNTDMVTLETDIQAGLVSQGANFCATGVTVDVAKNAIQGGVIVNQDNSDYVTLDYAVITSSLFTGSRKTYFGDCGCGDSETTRLCDYTVDIDLTPVLSAAAADLTFYFGKNTGTPYSNYASTDLGLVSAIDETILSQIEADWMNALVNLSGCAFTVGEVVADFDSETLILTVSVNGTNAAIGIVYAVLEDGLAETDYYEFTQSGCV